jgi:DNA ligase-1
MQSVIYSTPVLEANTKRGLKKYWQGHVVQIQDEYYTKTTYWQDKQDGTPSEVQESAPYRIEAANVGRSNEMSSKDRAIFSINSDYNKQRDKGYHLPGESPGKLVLPMLAYEYSKRKHSLGNSLCVQPKLDGCRALQKDGVFWSRQGKLFNPDITKHLAIDTNGIILDGELMLPKPYTFQDTSSAVKKLTKLSMELRYNVFDIVDTNLTFRERFDKLTSLVGSNPKVVIVPTYPVNSEEDIMKYHKKFCANGYEGTIIRDYDSKYTPGMRSQYLLKHKDFMDAEYKIIDVIYGFGKEAECAIFVCVTPGGSTFECRPLGSIEHRQEILMNKKSYIGKNLKVKFQNLTDDGIPRFPVGISVRPSWD